jgi:hypothetical protein
MGTPISDALAQRFRNGFTADCETIDAVARRSKRSGVALLFDEAGNLDEVVSLNGGGEHVEVSSEGNRVHVAHSFPEWKNEPPRSEKQREDTKRVLEQTEKSSYEQVGGEVFQKAAARFHEREIETKGRFNPVNTIGDAARRAKQTADAAKEKAIRAAGIQRSERIFAAMKERSAQIHK